MNTRTNWIDTVKLSLPEHASDLAENLSVVMTKYPDSLSEIDAHACALAAAMASGNGELAFEISMNSPLFGNNIRELVAQAVIFEAGNISHDAFLRAANDEGLTIGPSALKYMSRIKSDEQEQFDMFCFVVTVVNAYSSGMKHHIKALNRFSSFKLDAIAQIAFTVASISKVVI
jgi:hypothetical protein